MSLLQTSFRAYPSGSIVTPSMMRDQREEAARQSSAAAQEATLANQIQALTNCTRTVALKAARKSLQQQA